MHDLQSSGSGLGGIRHDAMPFAEGGLCALLSDEAQGARMGKLVARRKRRRQKRRDYLRALTCPIIETHAHGLGARFRRGHFLPPGGRVVLSYITETISTPGTSPYDLGPCIVRSRTAYRLCGMESRLRAAACFAVQAVPCGRLAPFAVAVRTGIRTPPIRHNVDRKRSCSCSPQSPPGAHLFRTIDDPSSRPVRRCRFMLPIAPYSNAPSHLRAFP